jgi:dihydrofolate synthase/folylpolyglutamate synthase
VFYKKKNADYLVLETGLGGRLDATNVIKKPRAVIITSISRDHMEYLGNTLAGIAREKGAIIKGGTPVIIGDVPEEAFSLFLKIAREKRAPVYTLHKNFGLKKLLGIREKSSIFFDYIGLHARLPRLEIRTINFAQAKNACMSLCCYELLFGSIRADAASVLKDFSVHGR